MEKIGLINLQSLSGCAFCFNLRGVYQMVGDLVNRVLDSDITDDLYCRASMLDTDAFDLYLGEHPEVRAVLSSYAFSMIRRLTAHFDDDDRLPNTCFVIRDMVKEISVLL